MIKEKPSTDSTREGVPPTKPYKDHLRESLQTLDDYVGYLSACYDEGPDVFQLAVKDVLEFRAYSPTVDEAARRAAEKIADVAVHSRWVMVTPNVVKQITEIISTELSVHQPVQVADVNGFFEARLRVQAENIISNVFPSVNALTESVSARLCAIRVARTDH